MNSSNLSAATQIIVDQKADRPAAAGSDCRLTPRRAWEVIASTLTDVNKVCATFDVPSHRQELQAIVELSSRFADDETSLPLILQGEGGPHNTKTANGLAMLNNNANTVKRAI